MQAYRQRTGKRLTYSDLAERTGLASSTLESISSRPGYNPSLRVIAKICGALECPLADLLELEGPTARSRSRRS